MTRWGACGLAVLATAIAGVAVVSHVRPRAAIARDDAEPAKRKSARRTGSFSVSGIKPRHGAKFVRLAADVVLRFSGPVDRETLTPENVVVRRLATTIGLDWTFKTRQRGRTVVLAPRQPFEPGADYEVVVTRGVRGKGGARLRRRQHAIFFTDPTLKPYPILLPNMFSDVTGRMQESRAAHAASLVSGGRVLLSGGLSSAKTLCFGAELFDPGTSTFNTVSSPLRTPRNYHLQVSLPNGSAVLIGGYDGLNALASTEWFNPYVDSISAANPMNEARDFHAAVTLRDGRVLVTGGLRYTPSGALYSDTAEIRGTDGVWRFTVGKPLRRRGGHTLTLLADGKVLVAGGTLSNSGSTPTVEIFDPATETFRGGTNTPRTHRQSHTATLVRLPDSTEQTVLLADGGDPNADLWNGAADQFFPAGSTSFSYRTRATASLLPTGDVLLAGGFETRGSTWVLLSSMDLYVHDAGPYGRIYPVDNLVFSKPRAGHTATTLNNGRVLFAGGFDAAGGLNLDTAVLFTPPAKAK